VCRAWRLESASMTGFSEIQRPGSSEDGIPQHLSTMRYGFGAATVEPQSGGTKSRRKSACRQDIAAEAACSKQIGGRFRSAHHGSKVRREA
jgi:hypothetical protein